MRLSRRRPGDAGSVLALVPAGFLVLMLLAAIAVDSAVAYQAQSGLHDALSAAANDAVSAGLDDQAFYGSGSLVLDPAAVASTVCQAVAAQDPSSLHGLQLAVAVSGTSVRVEGTAVVDAVFGGFVPRFGRRRVSSSADATLVKGPQIPGSAFGPATPLGCG